MVENEEDEAEEIAMIEEALNRQQMSDAITANVAL